MVDPDKKIARPVREGPPEREPWSQRDAKAVHALDLAFRLVVGFIAAVIGFGMLLILYRGAHKVGARGTFDLDSPYSFPLVALLGGLFAAFAIGQVLQLMWVGGDQGFDQRLWARMTSKDRGLWRLREGSSGRWTLRLFIMLTLAALLYVDAKLGRMLWQEALAGRWLPSAVTALLTLLFAGLALFVFRGRSLRSSADPGATWVSQGRWVIKGDWTTPGGVFFLLALSMAFLAAALWLEGRRYGPYSLYINVGMGLFFLIGGLTELREFLRNRRFGRPELEVVREVDRPLVLRCTATLPLSPEQAARGDWRGRLAAYRPTTYTRGRWGRWLDATAAAAVEKGTSKARFTLRVEMPKTVPYAWSSWVIRIECSDRRHQPFDFALPAEVVFTEEYPAE